MIDIDTRRMIERLNPLCTRALERAAALCVSRGNYEVSCEHLLLALLEDSAADVQTVLRRAEIDPSDLQAALQRTIEGFRGDNPGRPVWSQQLLDWLRDAWLLASVEYRSAEVRSGALLVSLSSQLERYAIDRELPGLQTLKLLDLRNKLVELAAGSSEDPAAKQHLSSATASARTAESALGRFTIDFTAQARAGGIDPVFCRDREIRQMIDILARRRKNNPILVGEAGVGKTAVVEGLALRIANNEVPEFLRSVDLLTLDLGLLQAGAGVRGEFEQRLKCVIAEVKASARPIILFIDEAHTVVGAGASAGGGDAANLLKPALARGELRTIAATTWSEYKKYFEKDAALARRFQLVTLQEPSEEEAVQILRGLRDKYAEAHGVEILDEAVVAAARLSARYISGRQLPDKAVDLLDTAAARTKIGLTSRPEALDDRARRIDEIQQRLDALSKDEAVGAAADRSHARELERQLEDERLELRSAEAKWRTEKDAVERVLDLYRRRTGGSLPSNDVFSAKQRLRTIQGDSPLIRPEVGEDSVARVVADWTGIPVGRMLRDEGQLISSLHHRLTQRIRGQDQPLTRITERIRSAKLDLTANSQAPIGVFLLVGPSGVGKTETAKCLADLLFGGDRFVVTVNMSEFQEKHAVARLIGSPPGYVGYGEGGVLTEAVRQRPYSVVLLDEVEKADPEVLNLFYQVFDKGTLADGEGRVVDFRHTVIFLTSNLAAEEISALWSTDPIIDIDSLAEQIRPVLLRRMKPALLARVAVVPYLPLGDAVLSEIVHIRLSTVADRLMEKHHIALILDPALSGRIAARCTDVESGARNVDHVIERTLLPRISAAVLDSITDGSNPTALSVDIDEAGQFQVRPQAIPALISADQLGA